MPENPMPVFDEDRLEQERSLLIDLMSATSEDRWCAGWMNGIDRELHSQGGIWECIGRVIGWPLGYRAEYGWVTWDEATEHYEAHRGN